MRPKLNLLIVLFAMALACFSLAQGGGGQRRGGGRNNTSISWLIFRPDVQTELALTDDEKSKLTDLRASMRPTRDPNAPRPTPEEMRARQEENEKKIEAILTPDQVKRLHEIHIQLTGTAALAEKSVQSDLGLSPDQISKLDTIFKNWRDANMSVMQKTQDGSLSREDAAAARKTNMEALKTEAEKVLTPDQLTKFQAMGGKPFTPAPAGGR